MESLTFEVSAKTAKLIGRENIADVDSALIELIKNSYDADASCVYVYLDMPFPFVPRIIEPELIRRVFSPDEEKIINQYYRINEEGEIERKENLTAEQLNELERLLAKHNKIVIADNGHGMDYTDVKTKWMYIGTSNKENDEYSPKGRVKTGAKGIGRFALDKLSLNSRMITKRKDSETILWKINWEQFDANRLLSQINAELEESTGSFQDLTKKEMGTNFDNVSKDYNWDTGTALILSPVRGPWSFRLFEKVNVSLRSINPFGIADPFKVFIENRYYPEYNFETEDVAFGIDDFDYRIRIRFDGQRMLRVSLLRNEIDIQKKHVMIQNHKISLDSFWDRPFFKQANRQRNTYADEVNIEVDITKHFQDDPTRIRNTGSFEGELFFGKITKSSEEIIKKIVSKKRKEIYTKYSGIKIYRDGFKVRPYGDEGSMSDWLGLAHRQALSPGGVGALAYDWKVLSYQMIGQMMISRDGNPGLYDMANREGLTQNDEFRIFSSIILKAIDIFETDRREVYHQYTAWKNEVIKGFGPDENIRVAAVKKYEQKEEANPNQSQIQYTTAEYEETVYHLIQENKQSLNAQQILEMLSSSGLILNTFFHEFRAFESQFGSRAAQLRARVDHMVETGDLHPGVIYDPYIIIDKMKSTDAILASWLDVAMKKADISQLEAKMLNLPAELGNMLIVWQDLMDNKGIKMSMSSDEEYEYSMSKVDYFTIINNFILNSVYFLEREKNDDRRITFMFEQNDNYYILRMWNNGPGLDEKYEGIPDKIFELGETSKRNEDGTSGTGVGLWITKNVVERYGGSVFVTDRNEGFGIDVHLKRQEEK